MRVVEYVAGALDDDGLRQVCGELRARNLAVGARAHVLYNPVLAGHVPLRPLDGCALFMGYNVSPLAGVQSANLQVWVHDARADEEGVLDVRRAGCRGAGEGGGLEPLKAEFEGFILNRHKLRVHWQHLRRQCMQPAWQGQRRNAGRIIIIQTREQETFADIVPVCVCFYTVTRHTGFCLIQSSLVLWTSIFTRHRPLLRSQGQGGMGGDGGAGRRIEQAAAAEVPRGT